MDDRLKGVAIVLLLLVLLLVFTSRSDAQDNCTIQPCEEPYYCPDMWVNIDGVWYMLNTTVPVSCYVQPLAEDEPLAEEGVDGIYTGQFLSIFRTDNGSEVYCLDDEGNGTLGIILGENVVSGTEFACGTFYVLKTGEYQINTVDGLVIIADNIQFVGAYYGMDNGVVGIDTGMADSNGR